MKKVFLSIASIFLAWQSFKLIQLIHHLESENLFLLFVIAWVINLFVTGVFAFLVFAYSIEKTLPESYYTVKNSKKLKQYFKMLKVELFRNALLATIWRSKKRQSEYFDGSRNGLDNLITQSKKSEWGHLLPFIIVNLIGIYFVVIQLHSLAILTLLINIIGNLYPILLQRHHRMRIQILRNRMK